MWAPLVLEPPPPPPPETQLYLYNGVCSKQGGGGVGSSDKPPFLWGYH